MNTERFRDTGIEYPQPKSYLGAAARVECTWRGAMMTRLHWSVMLASEAKLREMTSRRAAA